MSGMIEDPRIGKMQARGVTSDDDLPNKESACEEFERIGEDAAAAAIKVIQQWVLERYRDEMTAAEISSMKQCLTGQIAELITEIVACEYDSLPATLMDAEERGVWNLSAGDM